MNGFLGNLIDRHQELAGGRNAGCRVEPRPRAWFESEPMSTMLESGPGQANALVPEVVAADLGGVAEASPPPSDRSQPFSGEEASSPRQPSLLESHLPPDGAGQMSMDDQRIDGIDQRIEALSVLLGQSPPSRDQPSTLPGERSFPGKTVELNVTAGADNSSANDFSLDVDFDARIRPVLQRLQNQWNSRAESRTEPAPPSVVTANPGGEEKGRPGPAIMRPETTLEGVESQIRAESQTDGTQPDSPALKQPGLLQVPDWLKAMQADINQRWRELKEEQANEPVVNVTIGRVEVRAVPKETAGQSKPKRKSQAALSLDDYLKQRGRGRS